MKKLIAVALTTALSLGIAQAKPKQPMSYTKTEPVFKVSQLANYDSGAGFDKGGAEIVAYNALKQWAYVANGAERAVDILDVSALSSEGLTRIDRIKIKDLALDSFVAKDVTSVAVHPSGQYIALAVVADPKQEPGVCVILDATGQYISHVTVGALPDMVTFTPDGTKLLVANEGEPNDDFSVDPDGTVSIIELADMAAPKVITIDFNGFTRDNLPAGVKIIDRPETTVQQDLEPEYITVDHNGNNAYVSLQENNALAVIDLQTNTLVDIYSLGIKDYSISQNMADISNKDGKINIANWPVLGLYQPDGIDTIQIGGETYIVTANEGDAKDYDAYSEELRIKDIIDQIDLQAIHYANFNQKQIDALVKANLFDEAQMGRLKITSAMGKNSDGKYEAIYTYGGRSMSIYKLENNQLVQVYDSASLFENTIANAMPSHFNISNDNIKKDSRSDDKGPEPEDVKVGQMFGKTYAFVSLERQGGIIVMDISTPAQAQFVQYFTTRDYAQDLSEFEEASPINAGDIAPEGLQFIDAASSPTGQPLLLVANEVSGTVSVYSFKKIAQ